MVFGVDDAVLLLGVLWLSWALVLDIVAIGIANGESCINVEVLGAAAMGDGLLGCT